jgi:hypothetical protein
MSSVDKRKNIDFVKRCRFCRFGLKLPLFHNPNAEPTLL